MKKHNNIIMFPIGILYLNTSYRMILECEPTVTMNSNTSKSYCHYKHKYINDIYLELSALETSLFQ